MVSYVEAAAKGRRTSGVIPLHGEAGFEGMRKAGRLTAEALDMLVEHVQPGVTTLALDRLAYEFARAHDAIPAPCSTRGYRHSICTSINHVVCHGIPDERPLRDGDIVNIDLTLIVDGWYGDSSRMYPVGEVSRKAERLIEVTYGSFQAGLEAAMPGNTVGDIGAAIQAYAEAARTSVVRDFVGHGIGQLFHDEPNILHVGSPGAGPLLKPGMIFTIEPMINLGRPHVKILSDGWTAVTRDRTLSAQCEHSVASPKPATRCSPNPRPTCSIRWRRGADVGEPDGAPETDSAAPPPHYLGHRERLRERFAQLGGDAFSDAELLELVLHVVIPRRDTKELAKALLKRFGSISAVLAAPRERLREFDGFGEVTLVNFKVFQAVAQRFARDRLPPEQPILSSWSALIDYCHSQMAYEDVEQFRILFLDKKNRLIADEVQQKGTVDHTPVYPREVIRRSLELSATALILVHNHPSGDPAPSAADVQMTRQIAEIATPMGIVLHDHIIVGRNGHASLKALKLI